MKPVKTKSRYGLGFTIVELLTVMSVIVILMSILVPALNKVKAFAKDMKQMAQFHAISASLELFYAEYEGYPDSGAMGEDGLPYCGAMKLAEAMIGQDTYGFHMDSHFRRDLTLNGNISTLLYDNPEGSILNPTTRELPLQNARARKTYLQADYCNPEQLGNIYYDPTTSSYVTGVSDPNRFVICDVYPNLYSLRTGDRTGTPVLYYKANLAKNRHDPAAPTESIYNYLDNQDLVTLPVPRQDGLTHPLSDPAVFYDKTQSKKLSSTTPGSGPAPRPMRPDSYILLSAGNDGLYGTRDDITNFKED